MKLTSPEVSTDLQRVWEKLATTDADWCDVEAWSIVTMGKERCFSFLDSRFSSVKTIPVCRNWEFL